MIHRILRSRWLYAALVALVIWIFAFSPSLRIERPNPAAEPPILIQDPLELWPKELDREALARVVGEQPGVAVLLLCLMGTMAALFLAGIALSVYDLATGRGRVLWRSTPQPLPPWTLGDTWRIFALILFVTCLMPFIPALWGAKITGQDFGALVAMLGLDCFVVLTVLAFAQGKGVAARAVFLGTTGQTGAALRAAFRQYITAFPWLFLLLYLVAQIARSLNIHIPPEEIQKLLFREQELRVLVVVMVLACVVAPVSEELFFRGVIFGALRNKSTRWIAMLGSAAAFALVHTNPIGFLPIMALGCLLADLYERTGMLLAPIAVHVFHNTLLMSLALTFRHILLPAS